MVVPVSDRYILDLIRKSVGYKTTVGPIDKQKVDKALAGVPSVKPSSALGEAAWRLALRVAQNGPPPPPVYKKVAPITVTREGASDQRVCLFNPDGSLRPGVVRRSDGFYTDESGAVYAANADGLEESGVRTKLPEGYMGLTKAKQMDGRSACECPTAGSPTDNTGSWTV